jgi:hypothetical protein
LNFSLVFPCKIVNFNAKLEQFKKGWVIGDINHSGMKVWAIPSSEEKRPAELLAEM